MKAEQRPSGLSQPIEIPEWEYKFIVMDFMVRLPRTKSSHDVSWVIIGRLNEPTLIFFFYQQEIFNRKIIKMYTKEIDGWHGVPVAIASDKNASFKFRFQKEFSNVFRNKIEYEHHLGHVDQRTDRRIIQTIKLMLSACALDFKGSWTNH